MIRSVWRITRNAQDAEDAMQNALMAIWKQRRRIGRHVVPQALILKICLDAACDVARRRARHRHDHEPRTHADEVADASQSPEKQLASRELCREVVIAVNQLSRRQALAFTLRVLEELPYEQIAAAMGCSEPTARKHVERARTHLRVALSKHDPERLTRSGS